MADWIDNADSYRCPVCGYETGNPNNHNCKCPVCGFTADKDMLGKEYDLDRLRELEQADKEGRCVVLKFAPRSKIYRVWFNPRDEKFFITEHIMQSKEMCLEAELWNDAYKTREEAEKALEEMENKQ